MSPYLSVWSSWSFLQWLQGRPGSFSFLSLLSPACRPENTPPPQCGDGCPAVTLTVRALAPLAALALSWNIVMVQKLNVLVPPWCVPGRGMRHTTAQRATPWRSLGWCEERRGGGRSPRKGAGCWTREPRDT